MKKGYFLIDALLSITLILIISIYLIPTITSSIKQNEKINKNRNDISNMQNLMESIIAKNNLSEDFRDVKNEDYNIYFVNLDHELILVKIENKKSNGGIVIEHIIKEKGIYSN